MEERLIKGDGIMVRFDTSPLEARIERLESMISEMRAMLGNAGTAREKR